MSKVIGRFKFFDKVMFRQGSDEVAIGLFIDKVVGGKTHMIGKSADGTVRRYIKDSAPKPRRVQFGGVDYNRLYRK